MISWRANVWNQIKSSERGKVFDIQGKYKGLLMISCRANVCSETIICRAFKGIPIRYSSLYFEYNIEIYIISSFRNILFFLISLFLKRLSPLFIRIYSPRVYKWSSSFIFLKQNNAIWANFVSQSRNYVVNLFLSR